MYHVRLDRSLEGTEASRGFGGGETEAEAEREENDEAGVLPPLLLLRLDAASVARFLVLGSALAMRAAVDNAILNFLVSFFTCGYKRECASKWC